MLLSPRNRHKRVNLRQWVLCCLVWMAFTIPGLFHIAIDRCAARRQGSHTCSRRSMGAVWSVHLMRCITSGRGPFGTPTRVRGGRIGFRHLMSWVRRIVRVLLVGRLGVLRARSRNARIFTRIRFRLLNVVLSGTSHWR